MALHVRSLCPNGADTRPRSIVERLQTLDEMGQIHGFSVEIWGNRVPRDTQTAVGSSMLDRLEAFETWSNRAGTSLSPFFETRESGSLLTEDTRETVVPPVAAIAEFHDERLQYVAPCVDDGRVWTVGDRLDAIEEGLHDIEQPGLASD